MLKKLEELRKEFFAEIEKVKTIADLEKVKKQFSGKESPLILILKSLQNLQEAERQKVGQTANQLRVEIIDTLNNKKEDFDQIALTSVLKKEALDVSLPGMNLDFGTKHPLNLVVEKISQIFTELGFQMVDGTEVESDLFNFQKLNLPKGHPARDMQDTFYINDEMVMRTHATNMSARTLTQLSEQKSGDQTLASVSYGNVYRRDDDDATHSHQFMQIDVVAVGPNISFANLKWVLKHMCQELFGENVNIRLRPSFFPFTEPSVEVDISCFKCNGQGCGLCKQTGWIEILGAGMINEQVLKLNGLDSQKVSALAFGLGIERVAMLKFGINNIRSFYENNVKFLEQFKFYGE